MASSYVGGLSGAFIPVSEDAGMIKAAEQGALCLDKLEAMTCVCSVGLDMIAVPGDTSAETIAAIIADEAAIGMINKKTTAVRIIPVPGKKSAIELNLAGFGNCTCNVDSSIQQQSLYSKGWENSCTTFILKQLEVLRLGLWGV